MLFDRHWVSGFAAVLLFALLFATAAGGAELTRVAGETLTAVEMNHGDTLRFTLRSGEQRTLEVLATEARIVLTNVATAKQGKRGGQTVYEMVCRVRMDGQPMTMRRFVPVQQSLYEPYVINGMRIWFDGVRAIEAFLNDNHGGGMPRKAARFAMQDMTLPICPEPMRPWYPNVNNYIDVIDSYNGNDVWMGPYHGADLHGGLDVNMPIGTPLWAPIGFDTQFYFNSLKMGHNNNRWRGIRTWENGARWVLQSHHIVRLHVPQNTPLKQGDHYAEAAGILTGDHAHSHFVFKVGPEHDETGLDAWILFWQIFENNKARAREIRAAMVPLTPAQVGQAVSFDATPSRVGARGNELRYRWAFGDGGVSAAPQPQHVYVAPGVYPVTLTVWDGVDQATFTQHIVVGGAATDVERPSLVLESPDAFSFTPRPVAAMDVYGQLPDTETAMLRFVARPDSSPRPAIQRVRVVNTGAGALPVPKVTIAYDEGQDWLSVRTDSDTMEVGVDASAFPNKHGIYHADVAVACPGALNSPQTFRVRLEVPRPNIVPESVVIVDNTDAGCQASPWFWLAPTFQRHFPAHWPSGFGGDYLIAGGSDNSGARVRFTPDLAAGTYVVSLTEETPFRPTPQVPATQRFAARVRHVGGTATVWVEPHASRELGTFTFEEGQAGFVEILAEGANGLVVVDAVRFTRVDAP